MKLKHLLLLLLALGFTVQHLYYTEDVKLTQNYTDFPETEAFILENYAKPLDSYDLGYAYRFKHSDDDYIRKYYKSMTTEQRKEETKRLAKEAEDALKKLKEQCEKERLKDSI